MNLVNFIDNKISQLKKLTFFKHFVPSLVISFISIVLVALLHFLGAFDFLELKMYDFKFGIRGPLSAKANNSWPLSEKFIDGNGTYDKGEKFTDTLNSKYDDGEEFIDSNNNRKWDPEEDFVDAGNGDGVWTKGEGFVDSVRDLKWQREAKLLEHQKWSSIAHGRVDGQTQTTLLKKAPLKVELGTDHVELGAPLGVITQTESKNDIWNHIR